jgi:ABC-type antimicrobial peptide transport system permease subunit
MRRYWIVLFALILLGSVFMSACSPLSDSLLFGDNAAQEEEAELQTAPVRQGYMPTVIVSSSIFLAFGSTTLIGIFFGYFPANKAAQLDPIEALRYE